jgi:hypothetical protein
LDNITLGPRESVHLLPDGRHVCPKCYGGTEQEASLSVRRDEASLVHWRCFRSSCGFAGGPRGVKSLFSTKPKEPRYFTRPIKPLTEEQFKFLYDKFGSDAITREVDGYSYWDDRFILPVFGPKFSNKRGVLAYSFNQKPKSLTYNERPDEPFLHYATHHFGPRNVGHGLVIVEDWFSAEKVATTGTATGVCINGTYIDQAMITELVAVADGRPTWVALDRDAYTKTLLYLSKFREQFPGGLFAWSLRKDLKYETTERIREALRDGKVDFTSDVKGASGL